MLLGDVYLLLCALTLLGVQSAYFGPAKFSWPARTESSEDLPKVTGSIEALTFLAILLGSLIGGAMVENRLGLTILVMITAILGLVCAIRLPSVPVTDTQAVRRYSDQPQTLQARRLISWFWFLGASCLTQLPLLANDIMNLAPQQVSYLLAAFAVGVGVGKAGSAVRKYRLAARNLDDDRRRLSIAMGRRHQFNCRNDPVGCRRAGRRTVRCALVCLDALV